ncbi:MAG: tRNA preQ1(34) S-adenosylmethionine ribosyltransferase-isomerase QueA [Thermoplasmatales archaeon]|nr:tRNA preQ1(34) S-adenosylmethionine ribosyltransferase-isomerase QueA [Thermoplasmatales archaeon]
MSFYYNLPKERIAQFPKLPRDECKLLVVKKDKIEHRIFKDIVNYVEKGDVIVLNNSKVIKAKLHGKKDSGGKVEVLIIKKVQDGYECLIKGKISEGKRIYINEKECRIIRKNGSKCVIDLEMDTEEINRIGKIPLPPYIKSEVDENLYQTVFATEYGSIAAPTASLHFTEGLLKKLEEKGVKICYITLHSSISTFMNVLEEEYYSISPHSAELINNATRVFAVGTTTMKALESSSKNGKVFPSSGWSNLIIDEGYNFCSPVRYLITNFHMPDSPPLKLTTAFCGKERLMRAYEEALANGYRFLSFGDAMLICSE